MLVASPPSADEIDCDNVGDISVQEHSVIKKNKQILGFACVAVQVVIYTKIMVCLIILHDMKMS